MNVEFPLDNPVVIRPQDAATITKMFPNVDRRRDLIIITDGAGVTRIHSWNFDAPIPTVEQLDLVQARYAKLDTLATLLATKYEAGFVYNGKNFQIDADSQNKVNAWANNANCIKNGLGTWNPSFAWIASDNSLLPLPTPDSMILFAQAMGNYVSGLILHNFALKEAIRTAATAMFVEEVDITQGWP